MLTVEEAVTTLTIEKSIEIAAPVEVVWQSMLEEIGPGSELPDGTAFPMKIEAWPGGRWYRDLGNNTGHFWGHVQVIKPPPHPRPLLELLGPMPMSFPAMNHVQYRLEPKGKTTTVTLVHRAMGLIPQDFKDGMPDGWAHGLGRIKQIAEKKAKK